MSKVELKKEDLPTCCDNVVTPISNVISEYREERSLSLLKLLDECLLIKQINRRASIRGSGTLSAISPSTFVELIFDNFFKQFLSFRL